MRITDKTKTAIINSVHDADPAAKVWLFGSRVDNTKRGGDIDIAILSSKIGVMEKIKIRRHICQQIGEQKIDILVSAAGKEAFFRLMIEQGVLLYE
ncbi:MAG: nucleotidyltransferase domain-containing protein [Treponematales bacterium]